jgi:hypothetical protein
MIGLPCVLLGVWLWYGRLVGDFLTGNLLPDLEK